MSLCPIHLQSCSVITLSPIIIVIKPELLVPAQHAQQNLHFTFFFRIQKAIGGIWKTVNIPLLLHLSQQPIYQLIQSLRMTNGNNTKLIVMHVSHHPDDNIYLPSDIGYLHLLINNIQSPEHPLAVTLFSLTQQGNIS